MFINSCFFLFPFLLYLGIALQGLSFYLFGLVVPALFFLCMQEKIPSFFTKIGVVFILLHILFPIINFFIYFYPNSYVSPKFYHLSLKWPGILQSNFPSSLFFGGLLLILLTSFSQKRISPEKKISLSSIQPLAFFLKGLLPASCFFLFLLLFSHYTGVDLHTLFRKKIGYLSMQDAFQTGGFRVYGFYGHPLTVAGVCLTYTIFSWSLACSFLANNKVHIWNLFEKGRGHQFLTILSLIAIAFLNEICVFLSGGRSATIVGLILIFLISLSCYLRGKKNFYPLFFILCVLSVTSLYFGHKLGILSRIEKTTTSLTQNESLDEGNYRLFFWKTYVKMFLDKPLVGQGNYWLKQGVREDYYNKLGYENLPEKYIAHNIYLEILGSTGLVGLVWICSLLCYLMVILHRNLFSKESHLRPLALPFLLAFIANLLHGITQNVFFDSSVVYIYLCLLMVMMWEKAIGSSSY